MRLYWWMLPGPAEFIASIAEDLKYGNQVCLMFPATFHWNLRSYVCEHFRDGGRWEWQSLRLNEFGEDAGNPIALLFDIFLPNESPSVVRNLTNLFRAKEFYGRLVWLEGIKREFWPAWKSFLEDYAALSRKIDSTDLTRFVVSLTGDLTVNPPNPDMGLTHREWRGILDKLDMRLYCSRQIRNHSDSRVRKQLLVELSAHLAQWDIQLANELSCSELEELVEPSKVMLEYAREFGWDAAAPSWENGASNLLEDQVSIHSAFLALKGNEAAVRRRVWEAQLTVLFPLIEEWRLILINFLRTVLIVPFQVGDRLIEDVYEMEIGHISFQVRKMNFIDADLKRYVGYLWKIRNELAHMQPIVKKNLYWIDAFDELPRLLADGKRPISDKLPYKVSGQGSDRTDKNTGCTNAKRIESA